MRSSILSLFLLCLSLSVAQAKQINPVDSSLVEITGVVITGEGDDMYPVPFATVSVKSSGRGTYASFTGTFSIVCRKGETLVFSAIGYETVEYGIPENLDGLYYHITVGMKEDIINLPEVVIFPWPDPKHLRIEFLAMKQSQALDMEEIARDNLNQETLARISDNMLPDGKEGAQYYLRKQASALYYYQQRPPTPIFDPLAWAKFFKALKNGDFKPKD
jgi:hypothetical protein